MRTLSTTLRDFLHQNTSTREPIDLLTITTVSSGTFRWTNHGDNVTTGGFTWTAGGTGTAPLVERGAVRDSVGLDPSECDITLRCGTTSELAVGTKLQLAAVDGALDGCTVKLERCYLDSAGAVIGTIVRFEGQSSDVSVESSVVTVKARSAIETLNQVLPRNLYRPLCTHAVYDSGCQAVPVTQSGSSVSGTTTSVVKTTIMASTGYFDGGTLDFAAAGGRSYAVKSYLNSGGFGWFTLKVPTASPLPNISGLIAVSGCDKTAVMCAARFGNLPRRRGFDFVPPVEAVDP